MTQRSQRVNRDNRAMRLRRQHLEERSDLGRERRARRSYVRPYLESDLFGRSDYERRTDAGRSHG